MKKKYAHWLPEVIEVGKQASRAILDFYQNKNYLIRSKTDQSPITEADIASHEIIKQGLAKIDPSLPIISEEDPVHPHSKRSSWPLFWLVDPLDGTREFIKGTGEFTVNIALIENNRPVLGLVIAPFLQQIYWAEEGGPAFFLDKDKTEAHIIKTNTELSLPVKVALSRHHHEEEVEFKKILQKLKQKVEIFYYGSALKICLVARGVVDLYPRFGPTGEWDTAAGQCILEAAGGMLVDLHGVALSYNARSHLYNPAFLAVSGKQLLSFIVDKST